MLRGAGTVVISPTYNEAENLPVLVERFFRHVPSATLLVVDDASADGTAAVCRELQRTYPNLRLLERDGPRGLGRAYLEGMAWGIEEGFELVGTMDADLSHDPARLPAMLAAAGEVDVVIGSRYVEGGGIVNWGLHRLLLSRAANLYAAAVLRIPARDVTSGYRLYSASALARIDLGTIRSNGYSFQGEMLYRLHLQGGPIREVPILFIDRAAGRSKLGREEIYIGAFRILALRFRLPPAG